MSFDHLKREKDISFNWGLVAGLFGSIAVWCLVIMLITAVVS